jgi:hypothetical protein
MVIGAINDIALYRQLVARGVSEYVVPPFQPLQILRTISGLFADPDAPFVGKQISVVGAKGGVGASTIAHNLAWALLRTRRSIRHLSISTCHSAPRRWISIRNRRKPSRMPCSNQSGQMTR